MQVTQSDSEGLKREFKVLFPAADLSSRLEEQLADLKGKVRINGFRPGKVPLAHLRRLYGKSVMADIVQNVVNEANRKIVEENDIRLAREPRIEFPENEAEVERILEAQGDLAFTVFVEVLPAIEVGSFSDISLAREVAPVSDSELEEGLRRLADQNKTFEPRGEDEAAERQDKVTIDFVGKIDGEAFEGGQGSGIDIVLGSDSFIPGFEDQLVGVRLGDARTVSVRFPDAYQNKSLAGKDAAFDVTVKAIAKPVEKAVDDEFAKGFGFDDLGKLRDAMKDNLEREHGRASRDKLKRALLDELDRRYAFPLPESLVEQEFSNIWRQVEAENARSGEGFDAEGGEDAARAEYRRIAERRVRLGLLLAEVGEQAKIVVSDEELGQALAERARQFPGQEQQVWNYYRKNPDALAQIRAPLVEEKVVDHILGQSTVSDREVSREELFKQPEDASPADAAGAPAEG